MFNSTSETGNDEIFYTSCPNNRSLVQCAEGRPQCYERSRVCLFDRDVRDEQTGESVLSTCRDGAHLRNNCGKSFF